MLCCRQDSSGRQGSFSLFIPFLISPTRMCRDGVYIVYSPKKIDSLTLKGSEVRTMKSLSTTVKVSVLVLCALIVLSLSAGAYALPPGLQEIIEANYPEGLPAYETPEEKQWLEQQEQSRHFKPRQWHRLKPPKLGHWPHPLPERIRTPGEYEPVYGSI